MSAYLPFNKTHNIFNQCQLQMKTLFPSPKEIHNLGSTAIRLHAFLVQSDHLLSSHNSHPRILILILPHLMIIRGTAIRLHAL